MALFIKSTKTRVSGMHGTVTVKKFHAAAGTLGGREKAVTIDLLGEDKRVYSITLYGDEVEYLEHMIKTAKFEE